MSLAARLSRHMAGTVVGIVADRVLGEPPAFLHPVAGFGRAMGLIEDRAYEPTREAGIRHAVTGAALGLIGGRLLRSTAVASYVSVAGRGLGAAAHDVRGALAAGDLEAARARLPALVGRDPSVLDEGGISRAVVESVAENAVDAVVAPALWAALGGAAGATTYRAANTLDAMVGHHSDRYEEFGWASARLDDLMNWVPARLTALLVAAVRPSRAGAVARAVRRDAPAHPSPNAGVAEAAFAAALGLGLGGETRYPGRVELRPVLGEGRDPEPADIDAAVELLDDVTAALAAALAAGAALTGGLALLGRRRRRS